MRPRPLLAPANRTRAARTLALTGLNHALHDGFTDVIYVLLPIWQTQFALSYSVLAILRGLYSGTMACLQIPAGHLAERIDAKLILCCGTALSALGYALAGISGGIVGLSFALALAGAGSSTQHPLASAAVSRAYGRAARRPLGVYNFTGDLGKAAIPGADVSAACQRRLAARRIRARYRRHRRVCRHGGVDAGRGHGACSRCEGTIQPDAVKVEAGFIGCWRSECSIAPSEWASSPFCHSS